MILDSQSAFVLDRLIADNILVAVETVNYICKKERGHSGVMSLKLDISKTYDQMVEFSQKHLVKTWS